MKPNWVSTLYISKPLHTNIKNLQMGKKTVGLKDKKILVGELKSVAFER